MSRTHRTTATLATIAVVLCLGALPAAAQELYTFTVGALVGVGGSLDADPGDSLTNSSLQLNLSVVTEPRTHVGLRLARLDLDQSDGFGSLLNAEMTYLTVGGEYRYDEGYYESGIYLGLGGYKLEGTSILDLQGTDETALGGVIGVTGEFRMTRRLGILLELSAHYVDFEEAQFFAVFHGGVAIHF